MVGEDRKLNKNALRSRAMIREAFFSLLEKQQYNSISVTDIVKKADINRATFYAHYSCIADLTTEIENEVINKLKDILSRFSLESFCKNPTHLLLEVSKFIDENMDHYRILMEKTDATDFVDHLTDIFIRYIEEDSSIPDDIKKDESFHLRVYYTAGGISSLYLNWLKGKLKCSIYDIPVEIARIATMIIKGTIPAIDDNH